jgi:hypothetical protein
VSKKIKKRKNNENISPPIRVVSDQPHFSVSLFFVTKKQLNDIEFDRQGAYALPNSI